jgi:hypothetical protein
VNRNPPILRGRDYSDDGPLLQPYAMFQFLKTGVRAH